PSVRVCLSLSESIESSRRSNFNNHVVLRNASMQLTISHKRITSPLDMQCSPLLSSSDWTHRCIYIRELIEEGITGGLVIFEDRPNYWDACDVEIHDLEKATDLKSAKVLVVAQDPLRASVRAWVVYEQSITILVDAASTPARCWALTLDHHGLFDLEPRRQLR
ncbi:hypothetical protein B0H14DRAFT_3549854, partial [Mycena olivaceomarginata]